jgi:hypothetical protein
LPSFQFAAPSLPGLSNGWQSEVVQWFKNCSVFDGVH